MDKKNTFIRSFISRSEETGHYTVTILRLGLCGVRSVLFERGEINSLLGAKVIRDAAMTAFK